MKGKMYMVDCENEMCCYTCLNGEFVQDAEDGDVVACKLDGENKELSHVCLSFKDFE
jgi:hypothetical protein